MTTFDTHDFQLAVKRWPEQLWRYRLLSARWPHRQQVSQMRRRFGDPPCCILCQHYLSLWRRSAVI
jgi:hypothetical protein